MLRRAHQQHEQLSKERLDTGAPGQPVQYRLQEMMQKEVYSCPLGGGNGCSRQALSHNAGPSPLEALSPELVCCSGEMHKIIGSTLIIRLVSTERSGRILVGFVFLAQFLRLIQ